MSTLSKARSCEGEGNAVVCGPSELNIVFPKGEYFSAGMRGNVVEITQSVDPGGARLFPTPAQLLWASVGTRIGSAVSRFCEKQNIPWDHVKVVESIHHDAKGAVCEIDFVFQVSLDFPAAYQWDIIREAEQCLAQREIKDRPEVKFRVVLAKN